MKLLHDNEPVVKVASAASKETQRERSFLEHRYSLSVRRAACSNSGKGSIVSEIGNDYAPFRFAREYIG